MKRLIVLALILAIAGVGTFGFRIWDTQFRFYRYSGSTKLHYLLNQKAFDRLSEQLSKDPLIDHIVYYPPDSLQPIKKESRQRIDPVEQAAYDKRNDDIEAQKSRYAPLLADLNFPGMAVFQRDEAAPQLTYGIGPAADFGYVMMQSLLIHADKTDTLKVPCSSKPLDLPSGDCAEHLGGKWWIRYEWFTSSPNEPEALRAS